MSFLQPDQTRAMRDAASSAELSSPLMPERQRSSLAKRWKDLHATAAQLAKAADLSPEAFEGRLAAFPAMVDDASEWQREMAWQGVEDIDAMMRPGIAALQTLEERGNDPIAPALVLWREFHSAREAVLSAVERGDAPERQSS